jgi:sulfotransferase
MKTDKKHYFISGLPRSGSTLLCNILAQNDRFFVTPTSGLLPTLIAMRDFTNEVTQFKASGDKSVSKRLLRGLFDGYFSNVDVPVIFDKSRGWTRHIEMAEEILDHKAKIIVCVRDLREVLASFEQLWRKNTGHRAIPQEKANYDRFQTIEGRLSVFMDEKEVVGRAYNSIRDAVHRGYADRMLFVDFDSLTKNPHAVMLKVYDFLGEDYFKHNFENVEQKISERDEYYGFDDLHTIKPKVEPMLHKWPALLGEAADLYKDMNFWQDPSFGLKTTL